MTVDTVIEILTDRRTCMECVRGNGNCEDCDHAFDMAIETLKDSRWISVTERLPEKDGDYLVCIKGTVANIKGDIQIFKWLHGRWLLNWMKDCVTAWMELPKPYEEGAEK